MKNIYQNSQEVLKLNYFWLDSFEKEISFEDQSPELIKAHPPHPSTDIWNMALILYELTHGLHPFRGVSNYETCQKIMKEERIPFGNYISDNLIELLKGLLEKKSDFRWYFKEIFGCSWFNNYQIYYGFEIRMDMKEFNSPIKLKEEDEGSDESIQFKKPNNRRNSDTVNSAYLKLQRVKTKCKLAS